jgi:hypothetical protein
MGEPVRHEKSRRFPRSRYGYPSDELGLQARTLREQLRGSWRNLATGSLASCCHD